MNEGSTVLSKSIPRLLSPVAVENIYGISKNTLAKYRAKGIGPNYIQQNKCGNIYYCTEDLERWIIENKKY